MAANEKRLQRMRANPKADWTQEDVRRAAESMGCSVSHHGGSHMQIAHPAATAILTVPARRPIKPIYIRKLVAFLDEIGGRADDGLPDDH